MTSLPSTPISGWARVVTSLLLRLLTVKVHAATRRRVATILLCMGLVVQMVLLAILAQLVELCIALFEVWLDLAAVQPFLTP
jgi:hypothetical protein